LIQSGFGQQKTRTGEDGVFSCSGPDGLLKTILILY
jgi:hypothetical protein